MYIYIYICIYMYEHTTSMGKLDDFIYRSYI